MTHQRKHGVTITFYPQVEGTDRDGVPVLLPDMDNPLPAVRGWVIPFREQKAEVPGQQHVRNVWVGVKKLPGVGPWARARFWGSLWDVDAPIQDRTNVPRPLRHYVLNCQEVSGG